MSGVSGERNGSYKHGFCGTRVYRCWTSMIGRCRNLEDKNYGGRGIRVCKEWKDPKIFCEWALANGYTDELTIERKDNNKGYEPSNCTWIPKCEQSRNTSQNVKIEYKGKIQLLEDWIKELGLNKNRISLRRYIGISVPERLFYAGRLRQKEIKEPKRTKREQAMERNQPMVEKILNSGIDFSKSGWVAKVSTLSGIRHQKINTFMRMYMYEFWIEKCFKKEGNNLKKL